MKQEIIKERKIVKPSPARLAESLRDTGYTFETAVADVLDNSVSAGASKIRVNLGLEFGGHPVLMIADNGCGMDSGELDRALMYGSPSRPSAKSLGKFGMGLKTASTSLCRKLTVISAKDGKVNARQWDLDVIGDEDEWVLNEPPLEDYADHMEFFDTVRGTGNGTLVVWEKIDRLTRGWVQGTTRTQIDKVVVRLREHLSGVFYNFLQTGNEYPDIILELNDEEIEPWDPFCRWLNENGANRVEVHRHKPLKFFQDTDDGKQILIGEFNVNVYILPKLKELTDEEAKKARYKLDNQGFHVFREGRMIESGGWPNRIFVKEPHLNLIRVELTFDHRLDDYFQIDIKKSRIDLPRDVRDTLRKMITPARNEANKRYRTGNQTGKNGLPDQHARSSSVINKHHQETASESVVENVDTAKGEADVRNKFGTTRIKIEYDDRPGRTVQTKPGLQDGVLWMPALVSGNLHAVIINEEHEFYKRVYFPNRENESLVLAIDSLLWSLAEAELSVLSPSVKRNLEEMRISVSRILKTLAEELPEIDESENDNDEV